LALPPAAGADDEAEESDDEEPDDEEPESELELPEDSDDAAGLEAVLAPEPLRLSVL
jgi:hypothetical protein